jgi:ABC-2 type transport system permease protein
MNPLIDTLVLTRRNLLHIFRMPVLIVFTAVQPVMFFLLFTYVFGGAIKTANPNYVSYLLPGIIVQTALMGAMMTGISIANDLQQGVMDRFRSLPMWHTAILAARVLTDLCRNMFTLGIMIGLGFLVGFHIGGSFLEFLLGIAIALAFAFAFSWISATIGLAAKTVETAQSVGFIWVFPLVFASSIFVPIQTMPDWLQTFAKHSPVTLAANTVRALFSGTPVNDLGATLAWMIGLTVVAMVVANVRFRRTV